jgi:hypothetical protein
MGSIMKKTTLLPVSKLSLDRETLRSLTADDLQSAAGGIDTQTLLCPSKTWSASQSRTQQL